MNELCHTTPTSRQLVHWLLQMTPSHIISHQSQKSPLSQEFLIRGQGSSMEQATA